MTDSSSKTLPPIVRSLTVHWEPAQAFERFTAGFGDWWPVRTHSVGGAETERAVLECRPGGRIYERLKDGSEHLWGEVTLWEPPQRLRFLWHPSRPRETNQDVEITFRRVAEGTRVELRSWGWERWGKGARTARRGYRLGWGYVLAVWAGRRTLRVRVLDAITTVVGWLRRSGGPPARGRAVDEG